MDNAKRQEIERSIVRKGANDHSHGVYFVLGNTWDVISDYHCGDEEFSAVMDAVNDWVNKREAA